MLLRVINFFRGYMAIEITGAALERFLNICAAQDIVFWGMERISPDKIRTYIHIESFYVIRKYARRCMCTVHVAEKTGLPFLAKKYEKKYILILGILFCLLTIWVLTGYVWTISVEGNENMSREEILELLENEGVKTGTRINKIDAADIKNIVMMKTDKLSFFALNITGTHVQVVVRERIEMVEMKDDTPVNIISDKTGVITRLRIKQGIGRVQVGQTIMPGDIIAEGTIISTQGDTNYVAAEAEVVLRTWHTMKILISEEVLQSQAVNDVTKRYAITFGKYRLNLYPVESAPYPWYYKEVEEKKISISDSFAFPIKILKETYSHVEPEVGYIDAEKIAPIMEQTLLDILEDAGAEVVSWSFECYRTENGFEGVLDAECLESAGITQQITVY